MSASGELIEPIAISDVFVSGLGNIERIADCLRFSYVVDQGPYKVIVARLVIPLIALPSMTAWREQFVREIQKAHEITATLQ